MCKTLRHAILIMFYSLMWKENSLSYNTLASQGLGFTLKQLSSFAHKIWKPNFPNSAPSLWAQYDANFLSTSLHSRPTSFRSWSFSVDATSLLSLLGVITPSFLCCTCSLVYQLLLLLFQLWPKDFKPPKRTPTFSLSAWLICQHHCWLYQYRVGDAIPLLFERIQAQNSMQT